MRYKVTGMSCAACSAKVERSVSSLEGVELCTVNLLTGSMEVKGSVTSEAVIEAVIGAGYGASADLGTSGTEARREGTADEQSRETRLLKLRLISSLSILALLMYVSMGHVMWGLPLPSYFESHPIAVGLVQLILSAAVMIINQKFFINGAKGLVHLSPNMDTLVSLGSMAAFVYSTVVLFAMTSSPEHGGHYLHELYFESAAMVLTLITLGKLLEARAKGRTTDALKGLMSLEPETATLIRDGKECIVGVDEVKIGDAFVLRPGDRVPVDGVVLDGKSALDESALTGESIPSDKSVGDRVSAATINMSGYLKCRAERVGEDTTLAQIIKIVSDASSGKAPIAKIADRVSGIFVPFVIGVSLVTLAVWLIAGESVGFSLARAVSVLVISCPCALGLATPVAIMVGSGMGAKHGILFKTATSLEVTGRARTVALDKTGTITEGHPRVTDVVTCEGVSESELLGTALSLEYNSEHPLAEAVRQYAAETGVSPMDVTDFEVLPGNGLRAVLDGKELSGGNLSFIGERAEIDERLRLAGERLSESGKTPLYFSREGITLGVIAVSDVIKEDSAEAIRQLKALGIKVVMLTGDNDKTAEFIGRSAGVDKVYASMRPGDKEGVIRQLQREGRVIMVGDGINDAPALTRADIGIAVGAGTDIAIDAADVVIMKSRLTDVVSAVKLSRGVIRNIRENLFWAFGYNIIGIPLAAGAFIPLWGWQLDPMFGAAAMSLSSFLVVSNALRLNFLKLENKKEKENNDMLFKNDMKKTLKIEGMMCKHCEARVKKTLEGFAEVSVADVNHKKNTAVVTLTAPVENERFISAIEEQGYRVISIK